MELNQPGSHGSDGGGAAVKKHEVLSHVLLLMAPGKTKHDALLFC
jgi:hypothetical protein